MKVEQMSGPLAGNNVGEGPRVIGGKFLTFFLAGEEYGLEILKVQEIIGMMAITPVPRTPEFVRGVVNLRGKVIPVVDLRLKLEMPSIDATEETCIIFVRAQGIEMGIIVDSVSEVLHMPTTDIDPAPSFGACVRSDYILGIGKTDGSVRIILDVDRVLTVQDAAEIVDVAVPEEALAA